MKTSPLLLASLSVALLTSACAEEACTAEESTACSDRQDTCIAACGTGDGPTVTSCIANCFEEFCDCRSACGFNCDD